MAYRRLMGYPPYPNSGRAKKYGVPGIMGYQDLWVKGTSTVLASAEYPIRHTQTLDSGVAILYGWMGRCLNVVADVWYACACCRGPRSPVDRSRSVCAAQGSKRSASTAGAAGVTMSPRSPSKLQHPAGAFASESLSGR